jgi:hypothetical protein
MDQEAKEQAFITALVTEHFAQQSAASATITESSSRASLYVLSLSSSLVALGFTAQAKEAFPVFAACVLPGIFVLGFFTFMRLSDTAVENLNALRSIVRIRGYYAGLVPEAPAYFGPVGDTDDTAAALEVMATRHSWIAIFFTTASMIGVINSMVGGVGIALIVLEAFGRTALAGATALGVLVAVGIMTAMILYQRSRFETPGGRSA